MYFFYYEKKAKEDPIVGAGSASCSSCEGGLKVKQMGDNTKYSKRGAKREESKQIIQEITKGQG